ncbi:urate oxidase [Streptomyces sp. SL13]|uniref:Uricase n=1 Tax=Streptantibioticus silvisoli TaxID=2705255 RepID=A0AA90H1M4_9ACTN|nr:urate oxidase [Streptantibioticus silvisoli]MDI5964240.1 urate oxidase [Streptantibioticus silvisoli]MDI5971694.1 urate oxidase [Streptantibioticus silvisoli]
MTTVLGHNQYGKAETRVVRITRDGDTHHVRDLNVSVALSGDLDDVHYHGDNTKVLTTDTTKNTVYAFAQDGGIASPEEFALRLARHFTGSQPAITSARIRIEEYGWSRTGETGHSFVRDGGEIRTAQIRLDGAGCEVVAGLRGLVVLNSTGSEFRGFVKDPWTTLPESRDRVLATEVEARWRYGRHDGDGEPDWDAVHRRSRAALLDAFADTYSYSLQQTLYAMGSRVVDAGPEVDEIRLSMPNKHHFLVDLAPFGVANPTDTGAVYFAADRPYGLIEGTVLRDGAPARLPTD